MYRLAWVSVTIGKVIGGGGGGEMGNSQASRQISLVQISHVVKMLTN